MADDWGPWPCPRCGGEVIRHFCGNAFIPELGGDGLPYFCTKDTCGWKGERCPDRDRATCALPAPGYRAVCHWVRAALPSRARRADDGYIKCRFSEPNVIDAGDGLSGSDPGP